MERLQKYLARAGVASRRHAESLITSGRVMVNNQRVVELGSKVEPGRDLVTVDGKLVAPQESRAYFILYKPPGVVTTLNDPEGRPTVKDLFPRDVQVRLFPVGRLDYDAEGALLLTDDGALANRLTHPRFAVSRTYLAKVKGLPTPATLDKLRGGVRLEDGPAKPLSVEIFETAERNTWLKLVVAEGRPHLIKRMCAAIGHPVVRLFRPFQANVGVDGLRPGQMRPLTPEETRRVPDVAEGKSSASPALRLPARRHGRTGAASGPDDEAGDEEGVLRPFQAKPRAPRPARVQHPGPARSGRTGGPARRGSHGPQKGRAGGPRHARPGRGPRR